MAYNKSLSSTLLDMCYNVRGGDGMEYRIDLNYDGETYNVAVETPVECPYCHVALNPRRAATHNIYMDKNENPFLGFMYQCQNCNNIVMDIQPLEHDERDEWFTRGHDVHPIMPRWDDHSKFINDLSPLFIQIYGEAEVARDHKCTIVAGMGYRNALEHLVKDYAVYLYPDAKETIYDMPLSVCINKYIDDKQLKKACKGCNWLSNDYCHYRQKYTDYSLSDLIGILRAIEMYISCHLTLDNAGLIDKR